MGNTHKMNIRSRKTALQSFLKNANIDDLI